jgi:hypothetical protein
MEIYPVLNNDFHCKEFALNIIDCQQCNYDCCVVATALVSFLSGLHGGCSPIHFFKTERRIEFRSRPMRCLGFSNHEKGAPRQEISK